ncbi:DUF1120 domain-containing protein [Pseudomonas sp. REP124]|uniref:DUF1120 domain-containing protein n=1 Tax=Pseudomonas sp. REP124 TaxID=2875731 RepID=UPI001CCC17EF|nr:DUF1120 domain-containing protein [Pseudomonas sp. REP124]MBZ9781433.1 DUF1120 domain-containing protein [Pseudomonas sp. REP124]
MKKYLAALSATALVSIAPHAMAASSADLAVTGSITPTACTPSLSGNGNVDYGKISSKDLSLDNNTELEQRTVFLTVNCDAATRFALQGIDNRLGSSNTVSAFGLGKINGTQNLGRYMLGMASAVADGVAVQPIKSKDGQTDWHGHIFWMPGDYASVASTADLTQPILVKDMDMELLIGTLIYPARGLDLTNEVNIDGSATLEMKYL